MSECVRVFESIVDKYVLKFNKLQRHHRIINTKILFITPHTRKHYTYTKTKISLSEIVFNKKHVFGINNTYIHELSIICMNNAANVYTFIKYSIIAATAEGKQNQHRPISFIIVLAVLGISYSWENEIRIESEFNLKWKKNIK